MILAPLDRSKFNHLRGEPNGSGEASDLPLIGSDDVGRDSIHSLREMN